MGGGKNGVDIRRGGKGWGGGDGNEDASDSEVTPVDDDTLCRLAVVESRRVLDETSIREGSCWLAWPEPPAETAGGA